MVIKTSRRAMFRGMFRRAGFELDLDTANEILMRLHRSLDPIPVTEDMWASYLANRRPLRYSEADRPPTGDPTDIVLDVDAAVAYANFNELPPHVARQLMILLRIEALMRMLTAASSADQASSSEQRRPEILAALQAEIVRYVDHDHTGDEFPLALVDEIVQYLAKVAQP